MLKLVLPKGSLEKATLRLFEDADLRLQRASERDYFGRIDDPRIDEVAILRPQEIPRYVEEGFFDLGITGRDWIEETASQVVSLAELNYSKATSNPIRVVLAVPDGSPWESVSDLPDGIKVSTELPELTRRFFEHHGKQVRVFLSYGATEAKVGSIVDACVDVTETGSTLRKNGLRIIGELLVSRTELIANSAAAADAAKRTAMEDIRTLLLGAIDARGRVLLKLNVGADDLDDVLDILPSLKAPTINQLAHEDGFAVETVVDKRGVNRLIPELKARGASGILELPITKIVA
ncbi:MAG TPA: ATP phosphoribosyltransferase [Nitriliruptorales bacterium]|nr:ATP phosphoribosyltransferase [Nitriliruptorales bacterium]